MLKFREPVKEDVPRLRENFEKYSTMGCDYNFANVYLWHKKYNIKICEKDGFLLKAYFKDDNTPWGYSFPTGEGDIKSIIDEIFLDAKERNCKLVFTMLTEAQREKLIQLTGDNYSFEELTGDEDYIYTNYDLSTLPGKKYHSKRNHISKFNRNYPDWNFKIINKENMADAMYVVDEWCKNNNIDTSTYDEYFAIKEAFDNYETFKFHGGILYVDSTPVAMTMGAQININTFDVTFEKALTQYDGAYAKINNEFVKTLVGFEFINREEDLGLESLRKSKLSYHPVVILKRYNGVRND